MHLGCGVLDLVERVRVTDPAETWSATTASKDAAPLPVEADDIGHVLLRSTEVVVYSLTHSLPHSLTHSPKLRGFVLHETHTATAAALDTTAQEEPDDICEFDDALEEIVTTTRLFDRMLKEVGFVTIDVFSSLGVPFDAQRSADTPMRVYHLRKQALVL